MLSDLNEFLNRSGRKDWFWLILIALFAFLITLPIALNGVPDGNDLEQHQRFAAVFYEAIQNGDLFPGWAGSENMGFGSIGIRYYPPIAYYLMAFTQMLTGDWFQSFFINSFFWMFLGLAGVYFWAKEWLSPGYAFLAAALFGVVPYHLAQIYQIMFFAEYAASGILPFCFLFATRIIRHGKFLDVLLFSAAYSLLLLTHIPLTIIGSTGLAIYVILLTNWKEPRKTIFNFLIAGGLSLSATAFHWLRAVTEISWVKHSSPQYYANGYYDYKKFFFPLVYNAGGRPGQQIFWYLDSVVVFSILLLLPLIVCVVWQFKSGDNPDDFSSRRILRALAATGVFSIFILSSASAFIWNSFTLLQKTQFPWRWLALASLVCAVGFTTGVVLLISKYNGAKRPIIYAATILLCSILLFDVTQNIIPAAFIPKDQFEEMLNEMKSEAECPCWWTVWAQTGALERREKVLAESRSLDISRWDAESREFTIEQGPPVKARIATFYHPYWKAQTNGAQTEVEKADDGSILIPVDEGKASVRLFFQEPLKLKIALVVSLLTWFFLAGAAIIAYRKEQKMPIA